MSLLLHPPACLLVSCPPPSLLFCGSVQPSLNQMCLMTEWAWPCSVLPRLQNWLRNHFGSLVRCTITSPSRYATITEEQKLNPPSLKFPSLFTSLPPLSLPYNYSLPPPSLPSPLPFPSLPPPTRSWLRECRSCCAAWWWWPGSPWQHSGAYWSSVWGRSAKLSPFLPLFPHSHSTLPSFSPSPLSPPLLSIFPPLPFHLASS